MTGYLRKFVEGYSMLTAPLTDIPGTPQQGLRVQTSETCPHAVVGTATTHVLVPQVGPDVLPHSSLPYAG